MGGTASSDTAAEAGGGASTGWRWGCGARPRLPPPTPKRCCQPRMVLAPKFCPSRLCLQSEKCRGT